MEMQAVREKIAPIETMVAPELLMVPILVSKVKNLRRAVNS